MLPLAREDWRIEMMNPDRRRTSPFVLGGDLIQASYPTDEMTEDEKLMCMREIIRTSRTPPWFTSSIPVIICKAS
ncbi:MAG TPA: hypothetical protein VHV78_12595 [Gemmatimonadaceae bacterium]|nr:hypothetical protein [Gemmatimonadaceae bacterium]